MHKKTPIITNINSKRPEHPSRCPDAWVDARLYRIPGNVGAFPPLQPDFLDGAAGNRIMRISPGHFPRVSPAFCLQRSPDEISWRQPDGFPSHNSLILDLYPSLESGFVVIIIL